MYRSSSLLRSIVYSPLGIPLWPVIWEDVLVPVLEDLDGVVVVPLGEVLEHLVLRSTALIETIPFGNVIVGLLAIWIGYRLAYIAYTGREYIAVEDTD